MKKQNAGSWYKWIFYTGFLFIMNFTIAQSSVIGVGDIMLGTNYPNKSYLPPNDGRDLLKEVTPALKDADVTFGNLEGTLLNQGGTVKRCNDPTKCYAFRMPEHYVNYLKEAGFTVMSLANNHNGDFGTTGRETTRKKLESVGIESAGLLQYPTAVFERNGITYGFAAFAPNSGTVDIRQIDKAKQIIKSLDEKCNIIIVSFHGGAEGSSRQHVTKQTETFYGENRGNVYAFAHAMIDAGADVIFGHGPHVMRAVEVYKNRFIAYSLGNFATYGRFNLKGPNGIAPIIKVTMDNDGTFKKATVVSIKQIGEGGPQLDSKNKAFQKLRELTDSDFKGHNMIFENNTISEGGK
jgi:poly-gamma-glutamate capsule biosynthesis protein CapA/YwtB (metallophosphatase superfamily)